MINSIRNKPIAEQKQIAQKQREAESARKAALAQSVEEKKKWLKTETDLLKEKQHQAERTELLKKAHYKEELFRQSDNSN